MHQTAVATLPRHSAAHSPATVAPAIAQADLHLDWIGDYGQTTCSLDLVWRDPSLTQGIAGVYVIWSNKGSVPVIYYVGDGRDIGALLQEHANDPRIATLAWSGDLTVSWAAVASIYRPGVMQYLLAALAPLIVETIPAARPISVNLPL